MASMGVKLFRRGDMFYARVCVGGTEIKRSLGTRDRREAERLARKAEQELARRETGPGRGVRVRAFYEQRFEAWERRLRKSTLDGYRIGLRQALDLIGEKELGEVTRGDALRVAEVLRVGPDGKERSQTTIKHRLAPFQALWNDAIDAGLASSNPFALKARLVRQVASDDHSPQEVDDGPVPYTRDEQARLLEVIRKADFADYVAALLGLRAGLRRSEVLALTRADVDLETRHVHIQRRLSRGRVERPKTQSSKRRVPVSAQLAREIRSLIARQNEAALRAGTRPPEHLFPAKLLRTPDTVRQQEDQFSRRFVRYLKTAKVPRTPMPFHQLRHTFASELLMAGKPIWRVSKWLGHASIELTYRTYSHLIPDPNEHEIVDVLDQAVVGERTHQ